MKMATRDPMTVIDMRGMYMNNGLVEGKYILAEFISSDYLSSARPTVFDSRSKTE